MNLCSTRDPIHTHTVIYRFRAIASPPRGHRRQAQRSCPPRERPPEGILDIFFARCFFCFFLYFGCRGSVGSTILSWVHHIYLPFLFSFQKKRKEITFLSRCLKKKKKERLIHHQTTRNDTRKRHVFFCCYCVCYSCWGEDESAEKKDGGERCVGFDRE